MRYLPLLLLLFLLPGCDDDSSDCGCLPDGEWAEVALPAELVNGGVMKLATDGDRTVALAVSGNGAWVIEETGGEWATVGDEPLPGTAPPSMSSRIEPSSYASSVALDGAGRAQVAGVATSGPWPMIWTEGEAGWSVSQSTTVTGYLQDIVPLGERDVMAAGTGSTGVPWVAGSPGTAFVYDQLDIGNGEAGLIDLDTGPDGAVYGCGFNDGAEGTVDDPFRVVLRFVADVWELLPSPCGACGSFDLRAVEAVAGGLYVGGSYTSVQTPDEPYGNGTLVESAWLASYEYDTREWTSIVLPDPLGLEQVNAILQASDGVVYLACGGFDSPASILRAAPGEAPTIEWTQEGVRVFDLVEAPDGRILACGLEPGEVEGIPVILERAK